MIGDSITNKHMLQDITDNCLQHVGDTCSKMTEQVQKIVADTISNPQVTEPIASTASSGSSSSNNIGLAIAFMGILVFAAHLFAQIFSKKKVPDVLLLMIIGLIFGPILHIIHQDLLGAFGSVFTTVTLVIILFESGTNLSFNALLGSLRGTARLTIINFFVTMLAIGFMGWLCFQINPMISFMAGAILGGTSSAVVIPMVEKINMAEKNKTTLILESAFSDVLCIVFALALMESITLGKVAFGDIFGQIFSSFILATLIGLVGAIFWSCILDKVRTFQNSILTTPAFVFIIYGINEFFGYSGAIAALAFGIGMANIDSIYNTLLNRFIKTTPTKLEQTEKVLFKEVVFLLKTFFFVYIGISIEFSSILPILIGLATTIIIFLLRIPIVKMSIPKANDDSLPNDRIVMASMTPKGLAAAVLATIPMQAGVPGGEVIKNVVFSVILFSIIITSVLIPIIERQCKKQEQGNSNTWLLNFYNKLLDFNIYTWLKNLKKKRETENIESTEIKNTENTEEKMLDTEKKENNEHKND